MSDTRQINYGLLTKEEKNFTKRDRRVNPEEACIVERLKKVEEERAAIPPMADAPGPEAPLVTQARQSKAPCKGWDLWADIIQEAPPNVQEEPAASAQPKQASQEDWEEQSLEEFQQQPQEPPKLKERPEPPEAQPEPPEAQPQPLPAWEVELMVEQPEARPEPPEAQPQPLPAWEVELLVEQPEARPELQMANTPSQHQRECRDVAKLSARAQSYRQREGWLLAEALYQRCAELTQGEESTDYALCRLECLCAGGELAAAGELALKLLAKPPLSPQARERLEFVLTLALGKQPGGCADEH